MRGHTSVFAYTKAQRLQATSSPSWSLISGCVWTVGLLVAECTAHSSSFDRLQLKNNPLDVNKCVCVYPPPSPTPLLSGVNRLSLRANLVPACTCAHIGVPRVESVCGSSRAHVCIEDNYLAFRTDDSLQASHGVGGPVRSCCHGSKCWKQQISFQYRLQMLGHRRGFLSRSVFLPAVSPFYHVLFSL